MKNWTKCFMRRFFVLRLLLLAFLSCHILSHAKGVETILFYPSVSTVGLEGVTHKSVFHSERADIADAEKIINKWKSSAVSVPWTELQLELHVKHKISPSRAARGLALTHVAMHDAYLMTYGSAISDKRLAVSMAAARVLGYLFIPEEKRFERFVQLMAERLSVGADLSVNTKEALGLGRMVAEKVIERAEQDGAQKGWNGLRLEYYGENRYYGPGTWEPTPPYYYYPPVEPFAPSWKTWAISSASEFRPKPLPYGSLAYIKELKEVVEVGKNLTAEEMKIAKFWVDGHGTVTPPGHWNEIALTYVRGSIFEDGRVLDLFAKLNMALADSFVAAWDAKYYHWTVRPLTAARYLLGVDFRPFILTPPFPSYVSGHAAFSGAAAQILVNYFPAKGEGIWFLARQAAHSRLLGGIHFRHDNEDGLTLGRKVAKRVLSMKSLK